MRSLTQCVRLFLIVSLVAGIGGSANAADPLSKDLDAYVAAYAKMGKAAAVVFAQENTRANASTNQFNTWIDAQCKILKAKSEWITAVANVDATNAQTLETLQKVRSAALDNNVKVAKTFYDKRTLYDGYQGLNTRKRPTQEDVIRYSSASIPKRPASFELEAVRGRISWPEALMEEEFSDCRVQLDGLFAQRKAASGASVLGQVQTVTVQMREQLRSKIRQLSPAGYVVARRFLDSLAYEARFPARIDGMASK